MAIETEKDRDRIEQVLAKRKVRPLSQEESQELETHTLNCLNCARAMLYPDKYKRCDAMRVWLTEGAAFEYEINTTADKCNWCTTKAQHEAKVAHQTEQHPEVHRRMWEGVAWLFQPDSQWGSFGNYVRMQWAVSTYQVVVGDEHGVEQLVYHSYAQCE